MAARSIKEAVVGEPPQTNSVELFQLDDGTYQVVLRLLPPVDQWEAGSYPPPEIDMREYTNRVEARGWFRTVQRMLQKMRPPL